MWRPGFTVDRFERADLAGWHRSLCILSRHYRGSAAAPGLVLGLAPGGHCAGRALGVATAREAEVLAYLDERELITNVYERRFLPVRLETGDAVAMAWCYVARPDHEQYLGELDEATTLAYVRGGQGVAGSCADYVRQTVAHLEQMGIDEPALARLVAQL